MTCRAPSDFVAGVRMIVGRADFEQELTQWIENRDRDIRAEACTDPCGTCEACAGIGGVPVEHLPSRQVDLGQVVPQFGVTVGELSDRIAGAFSAKRRRRKEPCETCGEPTLNRAESTDPREDGMPYCGAVCIAKGRFYSRDWTSSGLPFVNDGEAYNAGWWFQKREDAYEFVKRYGGVPE